METLTRKYGIVFRATNTIVQLELEKINLPFEFEGYDDHTLVKPAVN